MSLTIKPVVPFACVNDSLPLILLRELLDILKQMFYYAYFGDQLYSIYMGINLTCLTTLAYDLCFCTEAAL